MNRYVATALLVPLVVLFFSGCDILSGLGECSCDEEEVPVEPTPYLKFVGEEGLPPKPVIPATDGSEHLYNVNPNIFHFVDDLYGKSRAMEDILVARPVMEVTAYKVWQERTTMVEFVQEIEDLTSLPVDSLTFSEHQLIQFARQNPHWITDSDYNDFLFVEIGDDVDLVQVSNRLIVEDMTDTHTRRALPFESFGGPEGPGRQMVGSQWRLIIPKFEE